MTVYELWDIESANLMGAYPANLMGAYPSEVEALVDVRAIIAAYGRPWVRDWELVRNDDSEPVEPIVAGEALIARALGEATPRTA
jgi:hypothetical protein